MKNNVKLQYHGFLETPCLWKDDAVLNLFQFEINSKHFQMSNPRDFNETRLGKRVEQFFSFQIKNTTHLELLASNIQIKNKKITIGELDVLLAKAKQTIHVEIIYKFYLYDPEIESENELDKWIGPNRKDTLSYKLNKLVDKQLPLLYSKYCEETLDNMCLMSENIIQQVCYKAQLFLPFKSKIIDIQPLNNACIFGYYLSYTAIEHLNDYQFFIPKKIDWLIIPNNSIDWLLFSEAKPLILALISNERSPLVWLKHNNKLQKCFITTW